MKSSLQYKVIFIIICIACFYSSFAQDSLKKKMIARYTNLEFIQSHPDSLIKEDTNILLFHEYNPTSRYDNFYTDLGYQGSVAHSLILEPRNDIGFDPGLHQFDIYKINPENVKFYDTYTPFTKFIYTQGANQLQFFNALYTRNVFPWWNLAVNYSSRVSYGFFFNQNTSHKIISGTSYIHTKNYRYICYIAVFRNKFNIQENGGEASDSAYMTSTASEQQRTVVRLNAASQQLIERNYIVKHILNLGKYIPDSVHKKKNPEIGRLSLQHYLFYQETDYSYTSNLSIDTSYYKNTIFNTSNTYDRFFYYNFRNDLLINKKIGKFDTNGIAPVDASVGIKYVNGYAKQYLTDTLYRQLSLIANYQQKISSLLFTFNGEYLFSGNLGVNNYNFKEKLDWMISKQNLFQIGLDQKQYSPYYLQDEIISNHLFWLNSYSPIKNNEFYTDYINNKYHIALNISYQIFNNYIYYSNSINPIQITRAIDYLLINIKKETKISNFHFDINIALQTTFNDSNIHLPLWVIRNSTYYQNRLFKGKLLIQIGFDFRIFASYYADNYYAPYSIFYKQDNNQIQSYPIFDLFLNAKIKRMCIFLKYENINKGFPENYAFLFPNYPMDPRVFRFGFSWMFYD